MNLSRCSPSTSEQLPGLMRSGARLARGRPPESRSTNALFRCTGSCDVAQPGERVNMWRIGLTALRFQEFAHYQTLLNAKDPPAEVGL